MADEVEVEIADGVALLTLNHPANQNALTASMATQLGAALSRCDREDGVRAVVLTGSPPAFCSGADLSETARANSPAPVVEPAPWSVRKPVIAAVNGHAVGIGLALALQCDLRYFAEDAVYGMVEVRRGGLPDGYAHWTLPRLAGVANAADILLTGRTFDGAEARLMGLANAVLPAGEVVPTAIAIAEDLAAGTAPLSVGLAKRLLWESLGLTADEVGRRENRWQEQLGSMPDAAEGMDAYLDRRAPKWRGSVSRDWPDHD